MLIFFIIIAVVSVLTILACCKVSSRCSREEERLHACETCLRWSECNGIDKDICPLWQKEETP